MKKPKKNKKRAVILGVLILLSALILISGLNKTHPSPFTTKIPLNYPTAAACSEQGIVIVDTQGNRMVLCNSDLKATRLLDANASGSPIDRIDNATMEGDTIYVSGSSHFDEGAYLSAEYLLAYDMKGNLKETLYSQTYEKDDLVNKAHFQHLAVQSGNIFLTCADENTVTVLRITEEPEVVYTLDLPETVYSAGYFPDQNCLAAIGLSQACYWADRETGTFETISFGTFLQNLQDIYHLTFSDSEQVDLEACDVVPAVVYNPDGYAQYFVFLEKGSGNLTVVSNDGNSVDSIQAVPYSTSLLLTNLAFWISVAFLGVLLLLLLLWLVVKKLDAKGRTVAVILGGILLTSIFYTVAAYKSTEKAYYGFLTTQVRQLSLMLTKSSGDTLETIHEQGVSQFSTNLDNQAAIHRFRQSLKEFCDANATPQSVNCAVYLKDKDGYFYTFADSSDSLPSGELVFLSDEMQRNLEAREEHTVISATNAYESFLYDYDFIYTSGGEVVGIVQVAAYQGNLLYAQSTGAINLFVTLAAIFIAIYTTITVVQTFRGDLARRRRRDPSDAVNRMVDLSGIFKFTQGLVYSMDSAILVYVAQSLCEGIEPAKQAILVALPISAYAAGGLVGSILFSQIVKRFGEKRVAIFSSILTFSTMILQVLSIFVGSIYLFILGKLLFGVFAGGMIYIMSDTLPFTTKDKEAQTAAINSTIKASSSSSIISILIGGFLSQYLSYAAIYLLGAALAVAVLFLCIVIYRNMPIQDAQSQDTAEEKPAKMRDYWTIFLKTPMLMYLVFYLFSTTLLGGYKSYLFPLYSAGAGISVLLLSNLSVFSKTLTYVLNDTVDRFSARIPSNLMLVGPMFVLCAGLLCFFLSPNIYWAIFMLLSIDLLIRMTKLPKKLYISDVAEEYGLEPKVVQSNSFTVATGIYVLQSPALSTFVSLGINLACTTVGLFCGGLLAVFEVYQRFRKKKTSPSSSSSSKS